MDFCADREVLARRAGWVHGKMDRYSVDDLGLEAFMS